MPSQSAAQTLHAFDGDDPWGFAQEGKPKPRLARQPLAPRNVATATGRTLVAAPDAIEAPVARPPLERATPRVSAIATALTLAGALVWAGWMAGSTSERVAQASAAPVTGRLVVSSHPAGARVTVDGHLRGVTPLALDLHAGPVSATVESPDGHGTETLDLTITAGGDVARHVTWSAPGR